MTRRRVVTERDVQRASRAGEKTLDVAGALVTPSARDAAIRARVELAGLADAQPAARTPKRSAPDAPSAAESARRDARRSEREPPRRGGSRRGPSSADGDTAKPAAPADRTRAVATRVKAAPSEPARPNAPQTKAAPDDRRPNARQGETPGTRAGAAPAGAGEAPLAVALGADHGGVSLKGAIAERLRELGLKVLDFGTVTRDPVDYPDFAVAVAQAVASGRATVGVMIDGAGIGSCMAANKVRGVRAAMCYDVTTAVNAREHNNANVLTLGAGLIGTRLALNILDTFLSTPFAGGRHAARVGKIDALDRPG